MLGYVPECVNQPIRSSVFEELLGESVMRIIYYRKVSFVNTFVINN